MLSGSRLKLIINVLCSKNEESLEGDGVLLLDNEEPWLLHPVATKRKKQNKMSCILHKFSIFILPAGRTSFDCCLGLARRGAVEHGRKCNQMDIVKVLPRWNH